MGISKVELGSLISVEHAKRSEFKHTSEGTLVCRLRIGEDLLPVVQTGPLTFEIDHPSGQTCRFSIEELLGVLGEDLCEHATGREGKTYPAPKIWPAET